MSRSTSGHIARSHTGGCVCFARHHKWVPALSHADCTSLFHHWSRDTYQTQQHFKYWCGYNGQTYVLYKEKAFPYFTSLKGTKVTAICGLIVGHPLHFHIGHTERERKKVIEVIILQQLQFITIWVLQRILGVYECKIQATSFKTTNNTFRTLVAFYHLLHHSAAERFYYWILWRYGYSWINQLYIANLYWPVIFFVMWLYYIS